MPSLRAPEKPFRFKEKNVGSSLGVIVGVVVLLLCLGLVVLMVVSEWSTPPSTEGRPSPSVRSAPSARSGAKKKAAPKAKKRKK